MDCSYKKEYAYTIHADRTFEKVKSLQYLCRSRILRSVTLDRVKCIKTLPIPTLLKEYLCSFRTPHDFCLEGLYINYHCNFPNHVHHKTHQVHPGRCVFGKKRVLIKSQHLHEPCNTCETTGRFTMVSTSERDVWLNLEHSNLMKCHMSMFDVTHQRLCLAFDFPSVTLQDFIFRMFLAKKRLPDVVPWRILHTLVSVFIYLENNGIIPWQLCHQQNVVITGSGEIKLENMLLYLPSKAGSKFQTNTSKQLSPEQQKGEKPTSKTLVWGLGCILYESTSRLSLSLGMTGLAQSPNLTYSQAVKCSRELSKVMCSCLRNNPSSRPGLLTLQQKIEKQFDALLKRNIDIDVNLIEIMSQLDRIPIAGGFLL